MIALIDFDNIPFLERQHGLVHIATRIAAAIGTRTLSKEGALQLRFYGGWFDGLNLSRNAQQLVPQISGDFPRPLAVSDSYGTTRIMTRAELAYSLACDPTKTLTHTYRPRSIPLTSPP